MSEWISKEPLPGDLIIRKAWYGLSFAIFVKQRGTRVYYIPFNAERILDRGISYGYNTCDGCNVDRMAKYDPELLSEPMRKGYEKAIETLKKEGRI